MDVGEGEPISAGELETTNELALERTASASVTLVADLERLAALRRAGDLTPEEFERAKARFLSC